MQEWTTSEQTRIGGCNAFSQFAAIAASIVAFAALMGWALDIPALTSVVPGFATMKANTALSLLELGIALYLLVPQPRGAVRVIALLFAAAAAGIGALSLIQYLWPVDLHIDQFLFTASNSGAVSHPGRMASATAV